MSSVSRSQAVQLSHPQVLGSYLPVNSNDQFLPRIPKLGVVGNGLRVTSVDALATAPFITSGGTADATATSYVSPAREFQLRRIAAKVQLDGDIAQNLSQVNDLFEQQIQAKQIAMWNAVGSALISGDAVSPLPAGLELFAAEHPDGVGDALGAPVDLEMLGLMVEHVRPWDGDQPRAFVMNSGQYANVNASARQSGFELAMQPDPILGRNLAHFEGIPLLVTDFITDTETGSTTSIYLVHLGAREGEPQLGGLVWFYNEETGAGIRAFGPNRNSASDDVQYVDLDLNIGFATLSTGAVYRLKNVQP